MHLFRSHVGSTHCWLIVCCSGRGNLMSGDSDSVAERASESGRASGSASQRESESASAIFSERA